MSFGAVTFGQDAFSAPGGTSIIVTISGVSGSTNLGNISVVGNAVTLVSGTNATRIVGSIGSLSIVGTAVVTLGSASGTTSVGTVLPVTSAVVPTTGLSATTAIGTLGFSTTGSVTLIGVQGVTTVGSPSVVSNANINVSSLVTTTTIGAIAGITTTANVTPSSVVGTFTVNPPSVTTISNMVLGGHEQAVQANVSLGTISVTTTADVILSGIVLSNAIGNLTLVGTANVSIAAFTGNNETRALSVLNAPSVESDANVDITNVSFLATTQFSGASTTVSADANVLLTDNVVASFFDSARYDTNLYGTLGLSITTSVNAPTIIGNAEFELDSVQATITFNSPSVIGNANIDAPDFSITSSLGTISIEGTANLTLPDFEATTFLGNLSVIGTAIVSLSSVSMQSVVNDELILTVVSAEDYNKDRTVYVDFRDNFINNVVSIEEEDRTIYIPEKRHDVMSKTLLAA